MAEEILETPLDGVPTDGLPELAHELSSGQMRFMVLPPGKVSAFVSVNDPTIDINLAPVTHCSSWNSDKLKASSIPANSLAFFPSGGEFRCQAVNILPDFLVEYDAYYWTDTLDRELQSFVGTMDFLDYSHDPVSAEFGRAGIRLLMEQANAQEPVDSLALEAIGWSMMARVIKRLRDDGRAITRPSSNDAMTRKRMDRVREYIETSLADQITLSELANVADMSMSNFSRSFKLATGQSPLRYVMERRVDLARFMLAQTDMPIARIAHACGFAGQSHFTRNFREIACATPAIYRRSTSL